MCLLSEVGVESWAHLFFECPFGFAVWFDVLSLMGSSYRVTGWVVELEWVCRMGCGSGARRKLWHVFWSASIYFVG